jgi:hypothetical protein
MSFRDLLESDTAAAIASSDWHFKGFLDEKQMCGDRSNSWSSSVFN